VSDAGYAAGISVNALEQGVAIANPAHVSSVVATIATALDFAADRFLASGEDQFFS